MSNYRFNDIPQEDVIMFNDIKFKISFLKQLKLYKKKDTEIKYLLYKGNKNKQEDCDVIGYKTKQGFNNFIYYKGDDLTNLTEEEKEETQYNKIIKKYEVIEDNEDFLIYYKYKEEDQYLNITLLIKLVESNTYIFISPYYLKNMQSKDFAMDNFSE